MAIKYKVLQQCGQARAGILELDGRSPVTTPVFMPVATRAAVKTLDAHDLETLNAAVLLCNAYHLYLRPGEETIAQAGGLHRFMSWPGGIITDSGGYQIFSLAGFRRIGSAGVDFVSHLDGSQHQFTPESNMILQHRLGADILMALDVCVAYPASREEVERSVELTSQWARRCLKQHEGLGGGSSLFGIIQGGIYPDMRKRSAQEIMELNLPGYGIGGLSVGEGPQLMNQTLELLDPILPADKPRYLMGVGTPLDVWNAIARGVDMMDCAMPTRIARNGTLFTSRGRLVVKNARYAHDESPPDPECACPLCSRYSRAYLRHLFNVNEISALRLSTLHNLAFMINLTRFIRESIIAGQFDAAGRDFQLKYGSNDYPG